MKYEVNCGIQVDATPTDFRELCTWRACRNVLLVQGTRLIEIENKVLYGATKKPSALQAVTAQASPHHYAPALIETEGLCGRKGHLSPSTFYLWTLWPRQPTGNVCVRKMLAHNPLPKPQQKTP